MNINQLMKNLKADTIREDGRLERHCKHGVGHTVGHVDAARLNDKWIWVHGCCGCCIKDKYVYQEVSDVSKPEAETQALTTNGAIYGKEDFSS